jgi:hypothetical protein
VPIAGLTTAELDGDELVTLEAIIAESGIGVELSAITLDFEASDGWTPSMSTSCESIVPIPGSNAAQGGVDRTTHDMGWDTALDYPGCMSVEDVMLITVADI